MLFFSILLAACVAQVPEIPPPGLCPIGEETEGGCASLDGGVTFLDGGEGGGGAQP
jgi:hypothetical protein